jgi:plastocyanin
MKALRLAAGLLSLALPAFCGDINGVVLITKRLTKKAISLTQYDMRGMVIPAPPAETAPESEFARTVVMLEGRSLPPKPPVTVVMEQRNTRFEPGLVVMPVGSSVQFPNSDPVFHNVFSLSGTRSFDLGYYPKGDSRTVKFDRSGIVQVYCHIHTNMYAAIVVTSSPYFGKPSDDGTFTWSNVPAGHYRLVAWHKVAGLYSVPVDVPEKGAASVKIRIPVDTVPHP